ncbi:hypothetical protein PYW07_012771 [Mythimna separata]|uniref:EGF-like domain-containing protein n=2 Tax=Mythimna separata TaxID=271217 RepID=A0AAD7Y8L4_MYTSE|nr:hypothetical protein PYW07_012771 [Mythimna separata]
MHSTRVVAVLTLVVGLAHCFPWDIVVGGDKQLHFYYDGTLTHTEEIPSVTQITSVTYDPVLYRVLFTDVNYPSMTISSFDVATRKKQSLFTKRAEDKYVRVVYDPVTQLLVWKTWYNIYTFSINPGSSNKAVGGNLLVHLNHPCRDVAVDSCGGYIYWITDYNIERARLDGSEREVIVDSTVVYRLSLAIDQETQRLYWIDYIIYITANGGRISIESANLNGKNRTTLYIVRNASLSSSLAVSKDFIYWQNYNDEGTWQLPKNSSEHVARKLYSTPSVSDYHRVATNYTIQEQIEGIQNCEALQNLIPNNSKPEPTALICQNSYCLEGNCSVNAGGQPTCSCKAGHSGERCEINTCHQYCLHNGVCSLNEEKEPVCQCTADYFGQRCEISICKEYCLQGNCSLGTDAQPKCSCETGYTGKRCEVNACHQYCLHNGVCTLNEVMEPVCQCTAGYYGQRCETSTCKEYCLQGNCSLSAEGPPKCSCEGGYSGARCEVNACHEHCLNNGICTLNEEDEPFCECPADYEGKRCDIAITQAGDCADSSTQPVLRDPRSEVRQVFKEEVKRILELISDKLDGNEAKC